MFPLFDHRKTLFYIGLSIAAVLISSQITSNLSPYGILFSFIGTVIFVLAFTHTWVRAFSYLILAIVSTLTIIISILLNNLTGEYYRDTFFDEIKEFLFFIAIFLCPIGIVIGLVGCLLFSDKQEKK